MGGWLLLTVLFSVLILIVQRAETNRRVPTLLIMGFVGIIAWKYALYRIGTDCVAQFFSLPPFNVACSAPWTHQWADAIASSTIFYAILAALFINILYWVIFGRSNPPGSSDSIRVIGLKD